jgi:hypothetical protein
MPTLTLHKIAKTDAHKFIMSDRFMAEMRSSAGVTQRLLWRKFLVMEEEILKSRI